MDALIAYANKQIRTRRSAAASYLAMRERHSSCRPAMGGSRRRLSGFMASEPGDRRWRRLHPLTGCSGRKSTETRSSRGRSTRREDQRHLGILDSSPINEVLRASSKSLKLSAPKNSTNSSRLRQRPARVVLEPLRQCRRTVQPSTIPMCRHSTACRRLLQIARGELAFDSPNSCARR